MKKVFLIIISFLFIPSVSAVELVSCGNTSGIPASLVDLVRFGVTLIKYLVPVLIIVFGSVDFFKSVTGGDSDMISKSFKKFGKKLIAGAIVFILVAIFQTAISLVSSDGSVMQCVSCFVSNKEDCTYYEKEEESLSEGKLTEGVKNTQEYEDELLNTPSSGDGTVLLIAGHSYPPYCQQKSNECRPTLAVSGYSETDETRKLAKLLKSKLASIGIEADIANELMAGSSDPNMNTSFYVEGSNGTVKFNSFDWSKYSYAIEIHFNASGSGNAMGTADGSVILLPQGSGKSLSKIDSEILDIITSYTGNKNRGAIYQSTFSNKYFGNQNVPFTYLETEFYDNKTAMDKYANKMDLIAADIAKAIKKYYG